MGMHKQAIKDLLSRYGAVFRHAWDNRKAMEPPKKLSHEHEFQPAALALQETPVHPAPRVAMRVIIVFAVIALLWGVFGKVDIVATARGKIVPGGRSKVIQPLDTAIVKVIHVQDGQEVKAGEILVELDATAMQADTDKSHAEWMQAKIDEARANAMLGLLQTVPDKPLEPVLPTVDDATPEKLADARHYLQGQYNEYASKWRQLDEERKQHEAEKSSLLENLHKLEDTLPIARQTEDDLKDLAEKDFAPQHDYLEKKQARIENERDLASTKSKLKEQEAVIQSTLQQQQALTAETRRTVLDQLHEATQKVADDEQDFIKANGHREAMTLLAPVDGTVQQLAVHTVGGVVTPAEQLMVVVPDANKIEVEAFVQNADVGFVNAGQDVQVKIDTFPFTRYGTVHGKVVHVSEDAIQEDARQATSPKETHLDDNTPVHPDSKPSPLVYAARVQLDRDTIAVDGKAVHLSPGMAVTVEVKTGKRRLIEFFLSPLLQYKDESLRER